MLYQPKGRRLILVEGWYGMWYGFSHILFCSSYIWKQIFFNENIIQFIQLKKLYNIQLLPFMEVNIQSCLPQRSCFPNNPSQGGNSRCSPTKKGNTRFIIPKQQHCLEFVIIIFLFFKFILSVVLAQKFDNFVGSWLSKPP